MVFTAAGDGDGIHNGADIVGIKTALPTLDLEQGGGDGLIIVRYEWDLEHFVK